MPIVTKQYRKIEIEIEFELRSDEANAGWEVIYIESFPFELYEAGLTQEDIDRECLPDSRGG